MKHIILLIVCCIIACNKVNPTQYNYKGTFDVQTDYFGNYYKTNIYAWNPLEEEPIICFNGKIASKDYMPSWGMFPVFVSDTFHAHDTLQYSISYLGDNYIGFISPGDTISSVICNGFNCKLSRNSSNTSPDSRNSSRDTILKAQEYLFKISESSMYYISMILQYDTAIYNSKWKDTLLLPGDDFTVKSDSLIMVDMVIRKYQDFSWALFKPIYSGNAFIVYQETQVDRKNLYLYIK